MDNTRPQNEIPQQLHAMEARIVAAEERAAAAEQRAASAEANLEKKDAQIAELTQQTQQQKQSHGNKIREKEELLRQTRDDYEDQLYLKDAQLATREELNQRIREEHHRIVTHARRLLRQAREECERQRQDKIAHVASIMYNCQHHMYLDKQELNRRGALIDEGLRLFDDYEAHTDAQLERQRRYIEISAQVEEVLEEMIQNVNDNHRQYVLDSEARIRVLWRDLQETREHLSLMRQEVTRLRFWMQVQGNGYPG